jgi:hypothetical protein
MKFARDFHVTDAICGGAKEVAKTSVVRSADARETLGLHAADTAGISGLRVCRWRPAFESESQRGGA